MGDRRHDWHGAVMTRGILNNLNTVPRRKGYQAQAEGALGHPAVHLTQPHLSPGLGKPRGMVAIPTRGCSLPPELSCARCIAELGHMKIFSKLHTGSGRAASPCYFNLTFTFSLAWVRQLLLPLLSRLSSSVFSFFRKVVWFFLKNTFNSHIWGWFLHYL